MSPRARVAFPRCPIAGVRVVELGDRDAATLQRFFAANPEYFVAVEGEPPGPQAAHSVLHEVVPPELGCTKQWMLGFARRDRSLIAMAEVVSDLVTDGVWHVGLFIVATARHGSGDAQLLYDWIERWAVGRGAQWMRLGVVQSNARAERFWRSQGFVQTRIREGVAMGRLTHAVRVMVKPLTAAPLDRYLDLVPRDRL